MPTQQELESFIYKLHYRTFKKIMPHVKERYGDDVSEQQVRDIIKSFVKDIPQIEKKQRIYYNQVFSPHLHSWMWDVLDNKVKTDEYDNKRDKEQAERNKSKPNYFLMFINTNTRYACAYPLTKRTQENVKQKLDLFLTDHKCVSLTSDKEAAFISNLIKDYLKDKNISQYIVLDDNHSSLSILDSFIRHLRDMNITNEKSKYQSHHSKYRVFSEHRMNELLDIYNNTPHSATKMKPIDMENNIKAERQYIANCLIHKIKKANFDIPEGHYVRIVLAKDMMKKRRFKVSREVYQITGRDGKNYFISAADGKSTSLPRFRLIDIGDNPGKYKYSDTLIEGYKIPKKILNIPDPRGGGFDIEYVDGTRGHIRKPELRRHHPQIESKLEKDYNNEQQQHRQQQIEIAPRRRRGRPRRN